MTAVKDLLHHGLDKQRARQSLTEERRAVADYTKRISESGDPKLKKILAHALREEKEHAKMFEEYLG
jgi:hypothetical protein